MALARGHRSGERPTALARGQLPRGVATLGGCPEQAGDLGGKALRRRDSEEVTAMMALMLIVRVAVVLIGSQ